MGEMGFAGHRMKQRREHLGIKIRELAAAIGVGETEIRRYESGAVSPRGDKIVAITLALRTSSDYLLGLTDEPSAPGVPAPGPDDMRVGPDESRATPRRRGRGSARQG